MGKIANYLSRKEVAIINLIGDLKINDEVAIEGSPKTVLRQKVTSIKIKDNEVDSAKAGCRIGIKVDAPVKRNDVVYRIIK